MIHYKKGFEDFFAFIKKHKIVLLFALLTSIGGILIIGNAFSNFVYFKNHRYNISLSKDFYNFFLSIRAFFYNNIIQGSAESFAIILRLTDLYKTLGNVSVLKNADSALNIFMFVFSIIMFFIINISSYIIILLDSDFSFNKTIKKIKESFLKLLILDTIKIVFLTFIFSAIALISYIFRINSTFYLIVSFFISTLILYFFFYMYHFTLRTLLLLDTNLNKSVSISFSIFKNNFISVFKNFIFIIFIIICAIFTTSLLILPLLFLNSYLIGAGYTIFNTIGSVFISIINLVLFSFINLFIYKKISTLYFNFIDLKV